MMLLSLGSLFAFILGAILVAGGAVHAKLLDKKKIPCDPKKSKRYLGKKKLMVMLDKLAKSPPPENLSRGAKCYRIKMVAGSREFVCSKCKRKTAYGPSDLKELDAMKRMVQSLAKKIDLELDDRNFCQHCRKQGEFRTPFLVVRLHDQCEQIRSPIGLTQLKALDALLQGKDRIASRFGRETAIKEYEQALRQMLLGEQ